LNNKTIGVLFPLIFLIFSILLFGCISDNSAIDIVDSGVENEGSDVLTTYHNDVYGYSFDIPKYWEEKYEIAEQENKTHFLYTVCPGQKDEFLTIISWNLEEFKKILEGKGNHFNENRILAKTDKYVFYYNFPIDLPYDSAEKEKKYGGDFSSMILKTEEIKTLFKLNDNKTN